MSLDDVVSVTITTGTKYPTRQGFGVPLLVCYHTVTPNRVDTYKTTKGMTDAGFTENDPAYKMAAIAFSQKPRPVSIKVGRRALAMTQTVRLTPLITTVGYVYSFTAIDPAGAEISFSYEVESGDAVADICDALAAQLGPLADSTVSDDTTHVTLTGTAGKLTDLRDLPSPSALKVEVLTADPGIATDLAAIAAADSTSWWVMCLDSSSEAEVKAAQAWVEANRKMQFYETSDSPVLDSGVTTDVASDLKTSAYARVYGVFSQAALLSYAHVAAAVKLVTREPGALTLAYKTLEGVPVSTLTDETAISTCETKRINPYVLTAGVNTLWKFTLTPAGEHVDVTFGADWLYARIQESVFALLASVDKVPYTDAGADKIRAVIMGVLLHGVRNGFLAASPEPSVDIPLVADVDPADRAARLLPDIEFGGTLAGAVHSLAIDGVLSV